MGSFTPEIDSTPRFGEPPCDAARLLVALAPADAALHPAPPGCDWMVHEDIAALIRVAALGSAPFRARVPGMVPVEPQPVLVATADLRRLLGARAVALRRMLARRRVCSEYRITLSGEVAPADMRLSVGFAQDLADLSCEVRATPPRLLPVLKGHLLFALSLMLPDDRILPLLERLEQARQVADARGLRLQVVGPDALRSFPVTLSDRAELVLDAPRT